jgi:transposase
MQQRKKPKFTLEFKQDAADLIISKGYSVSEAAASLGVSMSALRKWVRAEQNKEPMLDRTKKQGITLSEHEELVRLRKENAKLKMEREILKKAAVFFAQEHG